MKKGDQLCILRAEVKTDADALTAGDDVMDVGMVTQLPGSSVQHADKSQLGAEVFGIAGDLPSNRKAAPSAKSDIFDVVAYVRHNTPTMTREARAEHARVYINSHFNSKQQAFLDFVLSDYVTVGVEELDQQKLTPLLRLKYNDSMADAVADLGQPEEIGNAFAGFQKYLYAEKLAQAAN